MTEIEFEGKKFRLSADDFVPLAAFSKELFDLSPEDIGSFFDPATIRHKLRHNVRCTKIRRNGTVNSVCEGGRKTSYSAGKETLNIAFRELRD